MTATFVKGSVLIALAVAVAGTCPPCVSPSASIDLNDPNADPNCCDPPAGGPITGSTIVVTGVERMTENATIDQREATIRKWDAQTQDWGPSIPHSSWTGTWEPTGICSLVRDIDLVFEGVSVTQGENRYQVNVLVHGWDFIEEWDSVEVTYCNPPCP